MWFFLGRRKQQEPNRISLTHQELVVGLGDFSDLENEDVALKFWLPEAMEGVLEDLANFYAVTLSQMVRILLVDYVYGRYALAYMQQNQKGIFRRRHPTMFCRSGGEQPGHNVYKVPVLGKNIAPIKVYVARRLKDDLAVLAEHAGVHSSRMAREIIIGALLGRGSIPERPELRAMATPITEAWERGEPVPMREANRAEMGDLRDFVIAQG